MNTNNIDIVPEKKKELIDKLQDLLEEQIELVQMADPAGKKIEILSNRADVLVEEIKRAGILELAQFNDRKEKIQKLYDGLCLAISAKKDETAQELNRVRKGKKTLVTYRSNI